MNNQNNLYMVLFRADDKINPDLCISGNHPKFDTIEEAREFAYQFENATIFEAHFFEDSGDLDNIHEVE